MDVRFCGLHLRCHCTTCLGAAKKSTAGELAAAAGGDAKRSTLGTIRIRFVLLLMFLFQTCISVTGFHILLHPFDCLRLYLHKTFSFPTC